MRGLLRKLRGHFFENPDGTLTLDPGSGSPRVYTVQRDAKTRYIVYSSLMLCAIVAALLSLAALSLFGLRHALTALGSAVALIFIFPYLNDLLLRLLFGRAIVATHRKQRAGFWTEPLLDNDPNIFPRYLIRNMVIVMVILFLIILIPMIAMLIRGDLEGLYLTGPALFFGLSIWFWSRRLSNKWRLRREDR
jgi:hypothetical protein